MHQFTGKQQQMEAAISKYIRNVPGSLYDLGVGPKTEWRTLKTIYPRLDVFGCEPQADIYRKLEPKFKQIGGKLLNLAIADTPKIELFKVDGNPLTVSAFTHDKPRQSILVDAVTLDQFDAMCGKRGRVILWMDIEGYELRALRTGMELLKSGRVRWINLEERTANTKAPDGWCKPAVLDRFLTEMGYVRVCSYNRHPGHQDVIYRHSTEPQRKQ